MKFMISAGRDDSYCSWRGYVGKHDVTACNEDIDSLFEGMTRKLACKFEISNVRPRYYDYQTFEWVSGSSMCRYQVTEVTGERNLLSGWASTCIRNAFKNKGEKYAQIFVSIY